MVGDVTKLLHELKQGNRDAEKKLIPIVYNNLKKLAANQLRREGPAHSLEPTALVHEAYLRLTRMQEVDWQGRSHFFRISATVMRRILVDHARANQAAKRGDGVSLVGFDDAIFFSPGRPADVIALDEALKSFAAIDPRAAHIVELRFFAGMTEEEIGQAVGISLRTVKRDWRAARLWLFEELTKKPNHQHPAAKE
jgi:RNA polymerase sigma factor (TIGR02999 family)